MKAIGPAILACFVLTAGITFAQDGPENSGRPAVAKSIETPGIGVLTADEIELALERDGRIAIYAIFFGGDNEDIRPESRPQIEQLAALLTKNPDLSVLIVSHTDGTGEFDHNMSLSQRRAQVLAEALVSGFDVGASRLIPAGAGMVSPIASNRTEEGRAKNRRIEIVEHHTGD